MTILEIRTYRLHPDTTEQFHRTVRERCLPLLARFGVDVVRSGPSEQLEDGAEHYVLIRAFASHSDRDRQEQEFYGSRDWIDGPRAAVLGGIESYHTVVLTVPDDAVQALRRDDGAEREPTRA